MASNQTTVLLGTGVDTTPPTAPTNATATGATSTSISLRWSAATDDVGVAGVTILVDGALALQAAPASRSWRPPPPRSAGR